MWFVDLAELGWRVLAIAALIIVLRLIGTYPRTVTASIAVAIVSRRARDPMTPPWAAPRPATLPCIG